MNYYKRHLGDYAKDAGWLTTYQHGVFALLLDWYYANEKPLPLNMVYRIVRARSRPEIAAVDQVISAFFDVTKTPGFAHNKRADLEVSKSISKGEANSLIAKGAWDAKRMRNASETHSERNASHKPLTNIEQEQKKEQVRSPKNGSRLPPDFPDAGLIAWAKQERPDVDPKIEVEKFRDYWTAKPGKDGRKLDWPATWRNWMRGARANSRAGPHGSSQPYSKNGQAMQTLEAMKSANQRPDSGTLATPALPGPGRTAGG